MWAVEDQMLVHLVTDGDEVMGDTKASNALELRCGEYLAGRIVGRVHQNDPRPWRDRSNEVFVSKRPVGRAQRHYSSLSPCKRDTCRVRVAIRLEHDDLIADLADGENCRCDRLSRARGHKDLPVGIEIDVVEALLVPTDCAEQLRRSPSRRILVLPRANCGNRGLGNHCGTIRIGKALTEIDRLGPYCERGHLGKDRGSKSLQPCREIWQPITTCLYCWRVRDPEEVTALLRGEGERCPGGDRDHVASDEHRANTVKIKRATSGEYDEDRRSDDARQRGCSTVRDPMHLASHRRHHVSA